jgi:hypothetical protein
LIVPATWFETPLLRLLTLKVRLRAVNADRNA